MGDLTCGERYEYQPVRTRLAHVVLVAAVLGLGSCSAVGRAYDSVTNAVHSALYESGHSSSTRTAHGTATTTRGDYNEAPSQHASASPVSAPVVVDGLSAKAAKALLGQPARSGGPAPGETWTYRSGSCEVNLYLFPDVAHGGMQVLDHRVSGAGTSEDAKQACLKRLHDGQSG